MSDFNNPATQADKQQSLQNERELREEAGAPNTFFGMARAGLDLSLSGEGSAAGYVAGSEEFVRYPASGFDVGVEVGLEPPVGASVDALEPVGTPAEVAASAVGSPAALAALSDPAPGVDSAAIHQRLGQLFQRGLVRRKL